MSRLASLAIVVGLCVGIPEIALAAAGCPEGFTPQGGVCKPYRGPYVPPGRGYYYEGDRDWGYRHRRFCPDGYVMRHGECRPYRYYR